MSLGGFYVESNRVLAGIRCDHTKAELPDVMAEKRKTVPVYLPMRWELIEGRGFVSIAGDETGLMRGDEILAVDGQALSERVDEILPLIPFDGQTEWARDGQVAQSLEFRGGGLDHFGALLFETGPTADLTIQRGDEAPKVVTVERITHPEWLDLGAGQTGARNFKDAIRFQRIGESAAYLAVDTFVNYRQPVKPDTLYDPIFKALKDEGRETLIVDLRRNGGGSDDASLRLAAHLMSEKAAFKKDIRVKTLKMDGLEDYLWTWDSRAMNPNPMGFKKNSDGTYSLRKMVSDDLKQVKPDRTAFEGQLILLTSAANSSGSTHLLAFIKDQNPDAILIGERTGGNAEGATAGILFTLTLPNSGIKMRVPAMQTFMNIESFTPGLGVSPDIETPMTVQAFLDGTDPAYEKALSLIETSTDFDTAALD
ncbi:MAG: S41 family peptidase [Pseudomonadota bacterium]